MWSGLVWPDLVRSVTPTQSVFIAALFPQQPHSRGAALLWSSCEELNGDKMQRLLFQDSELCPILNSVEVNQV